MPELGDFFVTATPGWFARVIRAATFSSVNHCGIYVGKGRIIEAQPGGAALSPVTDYPNAIWSHSVELSPNERSQIAFAAMLLEGTPYNFLDIVVQGLVRILHWKAPRWALRRLGSPKRLQCAQLVQLCYERAGIILLPKEPRGLIAPGDLLKVIEVHNDAAA